MFPKENCLKLFCICNFKLFILKILFYSNMNNNFTSIYYENKAVITKC